MRVDPVMLLAVLLIAVGGYRMLGPDGDRDEGACPDGAADCVVRSSSGTGPAPVAEARADDVCPNTGYLCADLESMDRIALHRWKDFEGTLVVHVPKPDFEDPGVQLELQRAAMLGIRSWNNAPFPILVDTRGDRDPHFSVRWRSTLGGAQIGVARTRWSPSHGLSVESIELATRNPYQPGTVADERAVRLTAAHEMGHALGLQHSDSDRDVMFPTNTATAVSARDRRTMEVLYDLPAGLTIIR